MKNLNWRILLVLALVAAIIAYVGVVPENVGDLLEGLAVGLGIGALLSWFAERASDKRREARHDG
jgi:uncharacterized membrane protein YfcA